MRIRVTCPGEPSTIFYGVQPTALYLRDRYRNKTEKLLGLRPTLADLRQYTDLVKVERVDTSVHWKEI